MTSSPSPAEGRAGGSEPAVVPHAVSTWQARAGWFISLLCGFFLILDAAMKLMRVRASVEGTVQLGYPETVVFPLGVVLLLCTLLYLVPRTAVLGTILLTGYLGGATATHVRASQPFWFPIAFGILAWVAIWLRDGRLRTLVPMREGASDS